MVRQLEVMKSFWKSVSIFLLGGVLGTAFGIAVGFFIFPYVFPPPPAAESLTEADRSRLVASGTFIHANPADPVHWGRGKVSVYERTVFLEGDFKVGPGPKYHVYLRAEGAGPQRGRRQERDGGRSRTAAVVRGQSALSDTEFCEARRLQERGNLVRAVQCANFARRPHALRILIKC